MELAINVERQSPVLSLATVPDGAGDLRRALGGCRSALRTTVSGTSFPPFPAKDSSSSSSQRSALAEGHHPSRFLLVCLASSSWLSCERLIS